MSTVKRLELDRRVAFALEAVAEAQAELIQLMVQRQKVADDYSSSLHRDVVEAEAMSDSLQERVHQLAESAGVGQAGTALDKLDRIEHMSAALQTAYAEAMARQADLLADAGRHAKMVSATAEVG